jgi:hypothetical protein
MPNLFEVELRNRVVSGMARKPIRGTQGFWYQETLYYLADNEEEAEWMAKRDVSKRRVLGIPIFTRRNIARVIEILNTRRIS